MDKNLKKLEEGEETKDANAEIDDELIDESFVYTLDEKFVQCHCRRCKLKGAAIRRKTHCSKCKKQLTYSCETCNETYGNITDFIDHLKNKHTCQNTANGKTHPCPMCHESSCRKRILTHQKIQHGTADESSSVKTNCSEKFKSTQKEENEKTPFKCDKCSFATNLMSELVQHSKKHTGLKEKREKSDKIIAKPGSMRKHSRVCGNKVERVECHHCGRKFDGKDKVLKHLDKVHFKGTLNSRACAQSDQTLERYGHRSKHLRRCKSSFLYYGTDVRMCDYCSLILRPREWMKIHLGRCKFAPADCRVERYIVDQPDLDTACKNLSTAYCDSCNEKTPVKKGQPRCIKCDRPLKFACERCPNLSFKQLGQLRCHLRVRHVKDN